MRHRVLRFDYDEGLMRMSYVIKDERMEEVYQPMIRLLAEHEDDACISYTFLTPSRG